MDKIQFDSFFFFFDSCSCFELRKKRKMFSFRNFRLSRVSSKISFFGLFYLFLEINLHQGLDVHLLSRSLSQSGTLSLSLNLSLALSFLLSLDVFHLSLSLSLALSISHCGAILTVSFFLSLLHFLSLCLNFAASLALIL